MNWERFHLLAKKLAKINNDEAMLRSAINRTYYTAFHLSMTFAEMYVYGYIRKRGPGDHTKIVMTLKSHQEDYIKSIGRDLDRLMGYRIRADYIEDAGINKNLADTSIYLTDTIIENLSNYKRPLVIK